ncbi:MAG: T9SS type A sorting domain-containing protein [Bacteroidales bacterium]|nr:T9SS type A sorting domain-containing protein [Bacteroidales bacterium]
MKKMYFFILFLPILAFGQNYQTLQPEKEVYFEPDTLIHIPLDLFSNDGVFLRSLFMMPDSTGAAGNYYANFTEIHNDEYTQLHWFEECVDTAMQSWIGNHVLIKDNGMNVFFNRENDSIFVNTWAELNESFVFYAYPDGSHFLATVTLKENMEFLGITDNVKTIALQLYNADNEPVNSPLNGTEIMLTENFGFYKTINFRDFPGFGGGTFSVIEHTLFGHEDIANSFHKLTMRDVYDFEVGDEYHYSTYYSASSESWWKNKIIDILGKEWIQNDQVKYTYRQETWGYEGPPYYYDMFHFIDTVEKVYADIDTLINDHLPLQSYMIPTGTYDLLTYDIIQTDKYNGRPVMITSNDGYSYTSYNDCFTRWWFDSGVFYADYYIKGGGKLSDNVTLDAGGYPYSSRQDMVYFMKGDEEWGTQLEPPVIGIDEHSGNHRTMLVYPNPAIGDIHFSTGGVPVSGLCNFKLYDLNGRLLIDKSIDPNDDSIDVSKLNAGLYFYRVVGKELSEQGKIAVK